MISEIQIANFKAFGPAQRIPLRPITLLYGPNSSGKTTIIHALAFLRAALANETLEPVRAQIGMESRLEKFSLGSYKNIVFRQEESRPIRIGVELEPAVLLIRLFEAELVPAERSSKLRLEVTTEHPAKSAPLITEFQLSRGSRPVFGIRREGDAYRVTEIDPSFFKPRGGKTPDPDELRARLEGQQVDFGVEVGPESSRDDYWDNLPFEVRRRLTAVAHCDSEDSEEEDTEKPLAVRVLLLPELLVRDICRWVDGAIYLGADRTYRRPRGEPEIVLHDECEFMKLDWAWQAATMVSPVSEEVDSWLSDPSYMNTPYKLKLVDPPPGEGWGDDEWRQAVFEDQRYHMSLLHTQVGFGISQVIPVLATLRGPHKTYIIDQPELHLNPRLQTEIADVFISGVRSEGNRYLLETHSEHILLRLMRRIRETTEGRWAKGDPHSLSADEVSIVVLENSDGGTRVHEIRVDEHGEFQDPWPDGFFEEALRELL